MNTHDPSYGYDWSTLLAVEAPPTPDGFELNFDATTEKGYLFKGVICYSQLIQVISLKVAFWKLSYPLAEYDDLALVKYICNIMYIAL